MKKESTIWRCFNILGFAGEICLPLEDCNDFLRELLESSTNYRFVIPDEGGAFTYEGLPANELMDEFLDAKYASDYPNGFMQVIKLIRNGASTDYIKEALSLEVSRSYLVRCLNMIKKRFPNLTKKPI